MASYCELDSINRCILTGLGGNLAMDNDWGSVATQRGPVTYQSSGTEGSVPSTISFIQVLHSGATTHSPPDGQLNGGSLYQQERGHTIAHSVNANHRFVGSGPECWFLGYGETYSRHIQRGGRHGISSFRQSFRMDTSQRDLSEDCPQVLSVISGPICQPNQQPAFPVRVSISRSRSGSNRRVPLRLESVE